MGGWSSLHVSLLELILEKLYWIDIIRCKVVCSSWRKAAESCILSLSYDKTPLLILPRQREVDDHGSFRFLSLEDKRVYESKSMPDEYRDSLCVGSSHGWLVLLDKTLQPLLFNPFSRSQIRLPSLDTFPHIESIENVSGNIYDLIYEVGRGRSARHRIDSVKWLRSNFILKAILSSHPYQSNGSQEVFVFVNHTLGSNYNESKLAFCNINGEKWMRLGTGNGCCEIRSNSYTDIICCNDHLYALAREGIEVWNLQDSLPVKTKEIKACVLNKTLRYYRLSKRYLVDVSGKLLLIVRISNYGDEMSLKQYQTVLFQIYWLDMDEEKWVQLESMDDDYVLFLGGNHSVSVSARSVPCCEKNSIYFTDDYWNKMNERHRDGSEQNRWNCIDFHDMGVYNIVDQRVKELYTEALLRVEPPPMWIFPSTW